MTESTHAAPAATRTTRDLTKAAVSGWLGTAMEFLDFQLYSLAAAIVFNKIFFPNVSPAVGLIAAMATYGVGYVARLAGAIYFGRMGDRIGRKRVLFITIALMGASTTLIGVLPTYATVGLLAPILLVALRLLQGFGAGAEIAGATMMLAEYAPAKRRGLIASFVVAGHQLRHAGRVGAVGAAARRAVGGPAAQLGLAAAVPAQLRPDGLRGVAAAGTSRRARSSRSGRTSSTASRCPARRSRSARRRRTRACSRPACTSARARRSSWPWACGSARRATPGLVQTFLVGYIATALAVSKTVPPRRSSAARCSASPPSRWSACSATGSAAARSTWRCPR